MKKIISYIIVLMLLLMSVSALELREGDEISIKEGLSENLLAAGGKILVDAKVDGDVTALGGEMTLNSEINGSATTIGGDMSINGNVNGDIMPIGGNINVNGAIDGDVRAIGGNININGPVNGELVLIGGKLNVNGPINGDVLIMGGEVVIDSVIQGDAEIEADTIEFKEGALIKGNLNYDSDKITLNENQVEGAITKEELRKDWDFPHVKRSRVKFLGGLSLILVGIILVLVMPNVANDLSETIKKKPWMTMLYGFLALILTPIAAMIVMITIIGLPLGMLLVIVYILALAVSAVFPVLYLGKAILEGLKKPYKNQVLPMLAGGVAYIILVNIPFINGLTRLLALLLGLGAITTAIFIKKPKKKRR